jgi:hypothetical protein
LGKEAGEGLSVFAGWQAMSMDSELQSIWPETPDFGIGAKR